jgi:GH35 family endo-1,4-beta-xylanase
MASLFSLTTWPKSRCRSRRANRSLSQHDSLERRLLLTAGNGLQGQYFATPDLTGAPQVQIDSGVDFDWGSGSPVAGIPADQFSVRWNGWVEAPKTESFTFTVKADDGARLWVNGQLLIDRFESNSVSEATGSIDLIAGRRYAIQLEYREATGDAEVHLQWNSASIPLEVIPTSRLYAGHRGGLSAERWTGVAGGSVSDLTSDSDFPDQPDLVNSSQNFELGSDTGDDFGNRVRGILHAPESGSYRFYISGDHSAELWLSNSTDPTQKRLVAQIDLPTQPQQWDEAPSQRSDFIFLAAGQTYYIEALHKEASGADHLSVGWTKPGENQVEVIQGTHLSPIVPTVEVFSDRPNVSEGSSAPARFRIVRSGAPSAEPLTVSYSTSGTALNGTDYQTLAGTVVIPAGAVHVDLTISPIEDSGIEGDEAVVIELLAGSGYEVGSKSQRTSYGILQDDRDAPAGSTSLWNGSSLSDFSFYGGSFSTVKGTAYGDAVQAIISGNQSNPWDAQLTQRIDAAVTQGDLLFVEFQVRSIGGPGEFAAVFERAGSPYTKSLTQGIPATTDWSRIQIPFSAAESYAIDEAQFGFQLAYGAQTLQFADFSVSNYGPPRQMAPETAFRLNQNGGPYGESQTVQVTGQPFAFAMEFDTQTVPSQAWHFQAQQLSAAGVANGDTMRFEFAIRATSGALPVANFAIQRTDTYATLVSETYSGPNLTSAWQTYSVDLPVTEDFVLGGLQAVFNLGQGVQTIEVGGFIWSNLSNPVDLDDLPKQFPAASYGGRAGTDSWRGDAEARIESERKSDLTVTIQDQNGAIVDGAVVSIRQSKHEFLFGSAINSYGGKLDPAGNTTALKYQSEIKRLFNAVVLENAHKWRGHLSDPQRGVQGANFAVDNELYLRGHNVIWPSRNFMPDSIWTEYDNRVANDGKTSADEWLKSTIEMRFDQVLNDFDGQVSEWDVVNEPWSNHDVMDILGDNIIVDWYQRVRDFDPDLQLVLNDFGIFSGNGGNAVHRSSFDDWLGLLNDASLLDVIGEQSHYSDSTLTDIPVFGQLVNEYNSAFNQPIAITEFDVTTSDEQLQADYLRDYMTMAFSQPAINQFLHWGFWQDSHWRPDAALYRSDFSVKPNGQAYEDLVFGQWWSDLQSTSREGTVTANVFRGDYEITVQYQGQTYFGTVSVDDSGTSNLTINVQRDSEVAGRFVFYNQSGFDGNRELTNSDDDQALAFDKTALLPGQTATFDNYTSYVRGINGVIIDIAAVADPTALATSDFSLATGNGSLSTDFSSYTGDFEVDIRVAAGIGGSDRVTITLPYQSIANIWLQVTVKANEATGLDGDDVFYFGNAIAETNGGNASVDSVDVIGTRANRTSPFNPPHIENHFDFNRDGTVDGVDVLIARQSRTTPFSRLQMITAPNGSANLAGLAVGGGGGGSDSNEANSTGLGIPSAVNSGDGDDGVLPTSFPIRHRIQLDAVFSIWPDESLDATQTTSTRFLQKSNGPSILVPEFEFEDQDKETSRFPQSYELSLRDAISIETDLKLGGVDDVWSNQLFDF